MKKNGNDQRLGDYYVGIDGGTSSVGYAVTDTDYKLCRYGGNAMWGVRRFDEGSTAQKRRQHRINRRLLDRRKWRLSLLRELFDEEICKVDPGFFMRLQESSLYPEDKESNTKFSLFADPDYSDKDYLKKYPTAYHLRLDLIKNCQPHDIREVYLALHHIVKSRGHFLFDIGDGDNDFDSLLNGLLIAVIENIGMEISVTDRTEFHRILLADGMKKREKVGQLLTLIQVSSNEELDPKKVKKATEKFAALLVGNKVKLQELFIDRELPEAGSIALSDSEQTFEEAVTELEDAGDVLLCAKSVHDCLTLEGITGRAQWLSEYMVSEYEQHGRDIRQLKQYVKNTLKDEKLYKEIFVHQKENLNNYCAYSGYKKSDTVTRCTHEEFCKYLHKKEELKKSENADVQKMLDRIAEGTFAPKLRSRENGIIPNALYRKELEKILLNAEAYLPFLKEKDEHGRTVSEKIRAICSFRIPYYVGPLGKTDRGWAVRSDEKVYPWNLTDVVNMEESAARFILRMTSRCTFTGDDVLPRDSLLYSEFVVLDEINNIKLNGVEIPVAVKQQLYEELFVKHKRKVTKKSILETLVTMCLAKKTDTITGVDDTLKSSLSSYHKLKGIISKIGYDMTEELIRRCVLYGENKKLFQKWLRENTSLSEEDVKYASKQKFSGWGRLSKTLLKGLVHTDAKTGKSFSVIEAMRSTNENLMQLLSNRYQFLAMASAYKRDKYPGKESIREALEELYVSPKIRRSIWQTLRIIDEIIDIKKAMPKKIFLEVARDQDGKKKKKRTVSRKDHLIELYQNCGETETELFKQLMDTPEDRFNKDKLYLYYTQFGRSMYSDTLIDIDKLYDSNLYEKDHIIPRSILKDDSLDNLVLVLKGENQAKMDKYPISGEIRSKRASYWDMLKKKEMISDEKYSRLNRSKELRKNELYDFLNRQLVETRQSAKALAELLHRRYPGVQIVFSKAGNVSDFREYFKLTKCREVNDHHHAKDAYLNIVVGNYFDSRFTERFFENIDLEKYNLRPEKLYAHSVPNAWDAGKNGTIITVKKMMEKNNVRCSLQPIEFPGELFNATLEKKGHGKIPLKKDKSIEKYGGYNSASTAYFALVEYTQGKKNIRRIKHVLSYQRCAYERDPDAFAREYWYPKAKVLKVLIARIPKYTLFELNGVRMHISGRHSDTQYLFRHANQLILDKDSMNLIEAISGYVKKCDKAGKVLELGDKAIITSEANAKLYQLLLKKLETHAYEWILEGVRKAMEKYRDAFTNLPLLEQCKLILEILKSFRCDAQKSSFKMVAGNYGEDTEKADGKDKGGIIKSGDITSYQSAKIIHQSVTGLFEVERDLLK